MPDKGVEYPSKSTDWTIKALVPQSLPGRFVVEVKERNAQGKLVRSKRLTRGVKKKTELPEAIDWAKVMCKKIEEKLKEGFTFLPEEATVTPKVPTFGELMEQAFNDHLGSLTKKNTIKTYTSHYSSVQEFLSQQMGVWNVPVTEMPKRLGTDMLRWFRDDCKNGLKTCKLKINLAEVLLDRIILEYGVDELSPYLFKVNITVPAASRTKFVTKEERQCLFDVVRQHEDVQLEFYLLTIYWTQLRPDEIMQIRVRDLHLVPDSEKSDVNRSAIRIPGAQTKVARDSLLDIHPEYEKLLLTHKVKEYPPNHYIFSSESVRKMLHPLIPGRQRYDFGNSLRYRFNKYRDEAELPETIVPYSLKHTRAVDMVRDGYPLAAISKYCRHKNIVATQAYLEGLGVILNSEGHKPGSFV